MSEPDEFERLKVALNHVWDWLALHANQRLVTLRFYIGLTGVIAAGVATAHAKSFYGLAFSGSLLSLVITIVFFALEVRTHGQIKNAQKALCELEKKLADDLGMNSLELQKNSKQREYMRLGTFTFLFYVSFSLAAVAAILAAVFFWCEGDLSWSLVADFLVGVCSHCDS